MISDKNTKLIFTLPKELREKLKEEAESQNRSSSNLLVTIIQDYFSKKSENSAK